MPSSPPDPLFDHATLARLSSELADLPFPPVSQRIQDQAARPDVPALSALLQASRELLGDPALAWDPVEMLAMVAASGDSRLRDLTAARMETRLRAARDVVRQVRGAEPGSDPAGAGDDSAALHLVAVGLGLSMIAPLAPGWVDPVEWTALAGRLLEAIASDGPAWDQQAPARVWRARVAADAAGASRLTRTLWLARTRIDTVVTEVLDSADERILHLILVSPAEVPRAVVVEALQSLGSEVIVTRGADEDLDDIATRVLRLAARLAAEPDAAPAGAAALVFADSWEVTPAVAGDDASPFVVRLQWAFDRHVVLRRERAAFTRYDRERAAALLELVAALAQARGDAAEFGWHDVLPDGREVTIRLARPSDETAVAAMHDRCSEASRYQRYFAPMSQWRQGNLSRISGQHRGATLVVVDEDRVVIGLANVFPAGPDIRDEAEIALIVDDAWQGCGVGRVLLAHLLEVSGRLGFERLIAYVLAGNDAMAALLMSSGRDWTRHAAPEMGASVARFECPANR